MREVDPSGAAASEASASIIPVDDVIVGHFGWTGKGRGRGVEWTLGVTEVGFGPVVANGDGDRFMWDRLGRSDVAKIWGNRGPY